jgi:hypothetical protein
MTELITEGLVILDEVTVRQYVSRQPETRAGKPSAM